MLIAVLICSQHDIDYILTFLSSLLTLPERIDPKGKIEGKSALEDKEDQCIDSRSITEIAFPSILYIRDADRQDFVAENNIQYSRYLEPRPSLFYRFLFILRGYCLAMSAFRMLVLSSTSISIPYQEVYPSTRMIALGTILALENPDLIVALFKTLWTLDSGHLEPEVKYCCEIRVYLAS